MLKKICVCGLAAVGLFLTACNPSIAPPDSSDITETTKENSVSISQNTLVSSDDFITNSNNELDSLDEKIVEYALVVAQYFLDPIESSVEFKNDPHLYEFLLHTIYHLYKDDQVISLKNISEKDWYEEFLIPNEYLKKAAKLFLNLNTDLPEKFYTDSAFKYMSDEDAFRYSPFSPPMFVTSSKSATQNEDGTFSIIITISRIEETDAIENIYTYQPINDPEWGELYQLLSVIER